MEDTLLRIEKRLDAIEKHVGLVEQKLSCHITFIEATYNVLRSPLNFITNRVGYLMGRSAVQELPAPENSRIL